MKYIKKFENNKKPKIGDYVLMQSDCGVDEIVKYINEHIGQIEYIDNGVNVNYDENKLFNSPREFSINQIIKFDSNKEKLKILLNTKKYNL